MKKLLICLIPFIYSCSTKENKHAGKVKRVYAVSGFLGLSVQHRVVIVDSEGLCFDYSIDEDLAAQLNLGDEIWYKK